MRFLSMLAASFGLCVAVAAQEQFTIGSASIEVPSGWRAVKKEEERLTLRSRDDRQQATISLMRFGVAPSFEDFKRFCTLRVEAEKKDLPDVFIEPDAPRPFEETGSYGMFFSGGEKKAGRIFSGYLTLMKKELITVYVEGVGVAPKDHLASFETFVTGLKRK